MVFSSHLFVFWFLPAVLALYYLSPRSLRHLGLTLVSYLFYGWANPAFVLLMLFSTAVDYLCGLTIANEGRLRLRAPDAPLDPHGPRRGRQRLAVAISVMANLGLLGFFKYFDFGVESWNSLVEVVGLEELGLETTLRVVLPLGISFYTFQSMSYTLDVYRGQARALANPLDFACYVSLFPQLVAGPIIRFSEVADQLVSRRHSFEKLARGAAFFTLGMAKKVLLANPCGAVADVAFGAGSLEPAAAWWGLLAYAFQIYFDFSGYSDMAIGLGLALGFTFPKNFDAPYRARSVVDFWRRWHISLSSWLRDYLYIPLGGNRKGPRRTYVNLMVVMLLGGLWHGAAWNFVLWGGYHGLLLATERAGLAPWASDRLPARVRSALVFGLVLVGWVPFRARDLVHAGEYLGALVGLSQVTPAASLLPGLLFTPYALLSLVVAAAVTWGAPTTWSWSGRLSLPRVLALTVLLVAALVAMETQGYNPFIYFIF